MARTLRLAALAVLTAAAALPLAAQDTPEGIRNWPAPLLWSGGSQSVPEGPDAIGRSELSADAPPGALEVQAVPTSPLPFVGIAPCRIADTRASGGFSGAYGPPSLSAGTPRDFTLTGQCGIPATASAVSLNVTVVGAKGSGFIKIFPAGATAPTVSTLNYLNGQTIANAAVVPIGTGGAVTAVAGVSGTDFVIDTNGYYDASGLITQISPGNGITGGGTSGNVTVGIADSGVNTPQLHDESVTSAKLAPGAVVKSLNGLTDTMTLNAGSNVTITPLGQSLTIGVAPIVSGDSANTSGSILSGCTPKVVLGISVNVPVRSRIHASGSGVYNPNGSNLLGALAQVDLRDESDTTTLAVAQNMSISATLTSSSYVASQGFLRAGTDPNNGLVAFVADPGTYFLRLVVTASNGVCTGSPAFISIALTYFTVAEP